MTLALASITRREVVLTVDGRSTKRNGGNITFNDAYVKIIPVPGSRLAVYHHGQNTFGGADWKDLVEPLLDELADKTRTTAQARVLLDKKLDSVVRKQLNSMEIGKQAGFVAIGFGASDKEPSAWEILWRRTSDGVSVERTSTLPVGVVTSGDGGDLIPARGWKDIDGKSVDQIRDMQRNLIEQAKSKQPSTSNSVGGHTHEIVIDKFVQWTIPPLP